MSTTRQKPFRPRASAEITQAYNDGIVTICDVFDEAASGYLPSIALNEQDTLPYQERKLGIKRYYEAKQNQIHVERVIRVPKPVNAITNQMAARTEDGTLYRIDLVQTVPDVYPPSLDLTLTVYSQGAFNPTPPGPIDEGGGLNV